MGFCFLRGDNKMTGLGSSSHRDVQRRIAGSVGGGDACLLIEEHLDDLQVPVADGPEKRRVSILGGDLQVGIGVQQRAHDGDVALLDGPVQGRLPFLQSTGTATKFYGSASSGVARGNAPYLPCHVDVDVFFQQRIDDGFVPRFGGMDEIGVAVSVLR